MNKRQKEVQQTFLDNEKKVLKKLEQNYKEALTDIDDKIAILLGRDDKDLTNVIYQVEHQKALKTQVQSILEQLQNNEFETVSEYLANAYNDGFIGTMYDIEGQGIPLIVPIDQKQVVEAIQHETKLNNDLYTSMGKDVKKLQKNIASEISRGISTGLGYAEIARNIAFQTNVPKNNAMRIARTEAHRIQCKATLDAQYVAKEHGANVLKQWDSTLDGDTRKSHRKLDGQIRELDERFEVDGKEARFPGDFGDPAEDCNCRCAILQRARYMLDEEELNTLKERAKFFGLDKTKDFEDYKKKYLKAAEIERVREGTQKMKSFNKNGDEIQFSEALESDEKWNDSLNMIKALSSEYNTKLTIVRGYKKGENIKSVAGAVTNWGEMKLSSRQISTAVHEFAHSLAISSDKKFGIESNEDFWKEIRKIRTEYSKARRMNRDVNISFYAEDGVDEFLAEAFTQAKMKELGLELPDYYGSDFTYSNKVLAVVNKYFKKEKLENIGKSGIIKVDKDLSKYVGKDITEVDNQSVREWYYANVHDIENQIDKSKPFIEQVHQAYDLRNKYKHDARVAMSDRKTAEELEIKFPPKSFETLLKEKMINKHLSKEEALQDILKTASKTNANVDKEFGL